jgi:hypothetical protein
VHVNGRVILKVISLFVQYVAGLCFITRHKAFQSSVEKVVQLLAPEDGERLTEKSVTAGLRKAFADINDKQVSC